MEFAKDASTRTAVHALMIGGCVNIAIQDTQMSKECANGVQSKTVSIVPRKIQTHVVLVEISIHPYRAEKHARNAGRGTVLIASRVIRTRVMITVVRQDS